MYILLSGKPPFEGANDKEILRKIKVGNVEYGPEFSKYSKEALDLLKKMLKYEPNDWISAKMALKHPWI